MNLNEERNYQRLLNTLDVMKLSETNFKLAEQYLDVTQPENRELLDGAQPQDFSDLAKEHTAKCIDYIDHCTKRGRKEEVGRFVRFAAAVGGSTAYYVLVSWGWNLNSKLEYLTREQAAAIRAEGIVWNNYSLQHAFTNIEQKNPEVLRGAMKLCRHKYNNAKIMLAGISLYYTKAEKSKSSLLDKLLPNGKEPEKEVQDTIHFMENDLLESIPNLFTNGKPSDEELEKLQSFVREAGPDASVPPEIAAILQGKEVSEYLILLLAGAAFLSIEHSDLFSAFLCLTAAMDAELNRRTTLDICLKAGGKSWFSSHIGTLEDRLSIPKEDYMIWCMENKITGPVKRAVKHCPDVIHRIASKVSVELYQYLIDLVKQENQKLYQEMSLSYAGEFRVKTAEKLSARYNKGRAEVKQYLLGEAELDILYPFVKEWRDIWDYDTNSCQTIHKLKKNDGEQQLYRRAVVLEGLCMRTRYFFSYWENCGGYQKIGKKEIMEILRLFGEEALPVRFQIESLSAMYDSFYQEKDKSTFLNECVKVLRLKKMDWGNELTALAKAGTVTVRLLCIQTLDSFGQEYKDVLLACAADSSRQVREALETIYEGHKEWEPDIKNLLASKKSQEREMAVLVLETWGADSYRTELEAALAAEKSKKIKELLQSCLGLENKAAEQEAERTSEQLVKEILKGGKKRKLAWVYEKGSTFSEVHKLDGTLASEDYLAALLVSYADMGIPGVSADGVKLAAELNREELASYVGLLFGKWLESGAEAKKKWVLYTASVHGGEEIVPALYAQIQEWPKASRGAMAAEAVRALALNGSATALLLVDQISRKFKFRQVKTAAGDALAYAAEQLGITKAELEDRIVPNLGFDERMERVFDYGTRSFRVLLTPALELEIYDENNKKLKNLPAPGKRDEAEKAKAENDAFKLLKKQLKTVVSNQKLRLEQALSAERLWNVEKWTELFVKNPVMHQFAMGLIWGFYENGELKDTFRYMEDGSFNTMDEEEYEFPESGSIGLVHPIELDEESLRTWKEQLADYEVIQPVEQLERPIYLITEEERSQKELTRFGGKLLNGLSLSGKLQGQGWYRGSVQDAGMYDTFYREDAEVGVELAFSGCYVGDENEEVTVYGVQFYKAGTVKRGSYVYDKIKNEHQYTLSEISPRYFSEIVLQLTKATASSQEQVPYPECRNSR